MCDELRERNIESRPLPKIWAESVRHAMLNVVGIVRLALRLRWIKKCYSSLWSLDSSYSNNAGRNTCSRSGWKHYEKTTQNQSLTVCETVRIPIFHARILSVPVR